MSTHKSDELTADQRKATVSDRHLSITANAGSGKTFALVTRYLNILLNYEKPDPRRIAAITFTRKAAGELIHKIADRIEDESRGSDLRNRIDLLSIRERLQSAPITTIHSFCSSLLRSYPVEADVNPNFTEITQTESELLKKNTTENVIEDRLLDSGENGKKMKDLLMMFSRQDIMDFIGTLLGNKELILQLEQIYQGDDFADLIIERRNGLIRDHLLPQLEYINKELIDFAAQFKSEMLTEKSVQNLNSFVNHLNNFSLAIERKDNRDDIRLIGSALDALLQMKSDGIITGKFGISKTQIKCNKGYSYDNLSADCTDALRRIYGFAEAWPYLNYEIGLLANVKSIFEIFSEIRNQIDEEKLNQGLLDFDDMLIKAYHLLDNEAVADSIREKLDYLMIDEFQDTNQVQYDIVKKIAQLLNPNIKSPNFYVVGDEKQSIYGFRNADVRVFRHAKKDILEANKAILSEEDDNKGIVTFAQSFRHHPVVASFSNKISSALMGNRKSEYDVENSNLVCSINTSNLEDGKELGSEYGSVTFVIGQSGKNTAILNDSEEDGEETTAGSAKGKEAEAEQLALFLKKAIDGESPMMIHHEKNSSARRKAQYGDIAVLSRSKSGMGILIEKFQNYGIPYIVSSGKGFYKTQEIIDIVSCLKFLYDINDDLSLAGVLKSPLFDISETELLNLVTSKKGTLWESMQRIAESKAVDNLIRARKILSSMIPMAARLPISMLITTLLDRCNWFSRTSLQVGYNQALANVQKLIQYARSFEARGFKNLFDFVTELDIIVTEGMEESEAVFFSGENAVNIMTIHASKGLEFPIVVLYNTNYRPNNSTDKLMVDDRLGIVTAMNRYNSEGIMEKIETPMLMLARDRKRLAEEAEEKRILYVAITRAKEHLIISANAEFGKEKVSVYGQFKMLTEALGADSAIFGASGEIEISDDLEYINESNEQVHALINYKAAIVSNLPSSERSGAKAVNINREEEALLLDDILTFPDEDYYSATKLNMGINEKERYIRRYKLGLSEEEEMPIITDDLPERDEVPGNIAGSVLHAMMEQLNKWYSAEKSIDMVAFDSELDYVLDQFGMADNADLRERIVSECKGVASTGLIKKYSEQLKSAKFEFDTTIPVGYNVLNSKIDCLIANNDGSYEVWDWKTNKIGTEGWGHLMETYRMQMKIYAYFAYLLNPDCTKYRSRLLFTRLAKPSANDEEWTYIYEWTRDEISSFGNEISQMIESIK